jgi:glycine/D-amino acid oxidase-like deaminating enzyme
VASNPWSISLWFDDLDDDLTPRPPLTADVEVDVAIVGAGYTGLWTAYYLLRADPSLRVAIVEQETAGFGASGRNGGWCSALLAADRDSDARTHGRDAVAAWQRAMFDTVDEVGKVAADEGLDIGYVKSGTLSLATTPAHAATLARELDHERSWGFGPEHHRWLGRDEVVARISVPGCLGAVYTPHCAVVQPARLARARTALTEPSGASNAGQQSTTRTPRP